LFVEASHAPENDVADGLRNAQSSYFICVKGCEVKSSDINEVTGELLDKERVTPTLAVKRDP
jgi:hypothetical protein